MSHRPFRFTELAEQLTGHVLSNIDSHLRGDDARYGITSTPTSPFNSDELIVSLSPPNDLSYAANVLQLVDKAENGSFRAFVFFNPSLADAPPEVVESVVRLQVAKVVERIWTTERVWRPRKIDSLEDLVNVVSGLWLPDGTKASIDTSATSITDELFSYLAENPAAIYHLSPREFEELVAELFSCEGYVVELTQQSRDGGRDIIARKTTIAGNETLAVECKRYAKDNKVGIDVVQRINGVRDEMQATKGVVATTSFFTQPALDSADLKANHIGLLDYYAICEFLTKHQTSK
ncbi:Restriction endonuclease [Gimesia alba]|uniref:Restriction endonuclease n=1 Tax=Gimesia alba TaxID=2527973 RepID=A0A517RHV5_9PLAN|nr:restriction endonuclease [Gimesia alba]QDT43457.1 Restriction endonuclease [Gimesia alba]